MSIDEKLKYISKKLKEHNFQNDIQVRYNDSIKMFEIYVLDNEQEDDFFYGKGNTFEEAMEDFMYKPDGVYYIDEVMHEYYEEERRELAYKNKVYWDKQLYRNAYKEDFRCLDMSMTNGKQCQILMKSKKVNIRKQKKI